MKELFLLAICIINTAFVFSIEFTIAPLYFVDETIDQAFPKNDFHERLYKELGKVALDTGLRFKNTGSSRYNPPQSVGDAVILCRAEKAEYLIYGYIVRKDQTINGELRILDYERKEVIARFFAMDSKEREDELIKDLAGKLFRFLQETYNIKIVPPVPSFTHIQFPLSMGYWFPMGKDWLGLLYGIVRVDGGIQIIPDDMAVISTGSIYYISLGIDFSYRLGFGRFYDAWDHGFSVSTPILIHKKINEQHGAYIGLGQFYSLDLLYIRKPYEDPAIEIFDTLGLIFYGGWSFRFKERLFFFIDAMLEIAFYDKTMINFSTRSGIILRKYTQEVVRKW